MKKRIALLLSAVLALGLITGCTTTGSSDAAKPASTSADAQTQPPGEPRPQNFTFAAHNDIMTLDVSQMNDEMSALVMYAVNEPLIRYTKNTIQPGIAEEYTASEDGLVYTFKLRDAQWSDGQPVTAEDFAFSFLRTLDPNTGSSQVDVFDAIKGAQQYYSGETTDPATVGIVAADEKTLEITLTRPDPFFLEHVAQGINFYPIRKDYVEKYGDTYGSSPETFIGCGPFTLTEWQQGASLTMDKNPGYWNFEAIKLDRATQLIVPDENTRTGMFDLGEIDGIFSISAAQTAQYPNFGSRSGGSIQYLVFNNSTQLLGNKNLRLALSTAIDRDSIVKAISAPGTQVASRMLDDTIALDGKSIGQQYPASNGIPGAGDAAKAKAYLEAALKELNIPSADKLPEINYVCLDSATHKAYAEALQAQWKDVLGVNVNVNIKPVPQAIGALLAGEFDIFLNGTSTGVSPDEVIKGYVTGSSSNYALWDDADFSQLMNQQQEAVDLIQRFELLQQAEQRMLDESPVAPLWFPGSAYLMQDYVQDVYFGRQTGSMEFIYAYLL